MINMNPVREESAPEEIKVIYEDIKDSLKLPWVPVMFQAFAMYPPCLQFIWNQLKPSVGTAQFHSEAERIRGYAETFMSEAHIQEYKHEDALRNNLSVNDLVHIRTGLEAFTYGNPKLLLLAAALKRAVGGITVGGNGDTASLHDEFGDRVIKKIDIEPVEESGAPDEVLGVYEDIKSTLAVPFVNTDYKTMANWPGFLKLAWEDIKIFMSTPYYSEGKGAMLEFAEVSADLLPYPVKMGRDEMEGAGVHEEDFEDLEDLAYLFAGLLPGLTLSVVEMRLVAEDMLEVDRGEYAA